MDRDAREHRESNIAITGHATRQHARKHRQVLKRIHGGDIRSEPADRTERTRWLGARCAHHPPAVPRGSPADSPLSRKRSAPRSFLAFGMNLVAALKVCLSPPFDGWMRVCLLAIFPRPPNDSPTTGFQAEGPALPLPPGRQITTLYQCLGRGAANPGKTPRRLCCTATCIDSDWAYNAIPTHI